MKMKRLCRWRSWKKSAPPCHEGLLNRRAVTVGCVATSAAVHARGTRKLAKKLCVRRTGPVAVCRWDASELVRNGMEQNRRERILPQVVLPVRVGEIQQNIQRSGRKP